MERLTKRCGDVALIADSLEGKYTAEQVIDLLAERLAAYEDTGLQPDGVEATVRQLNTIVERYGLYHDGRGDAILELLTACKAGKLAYLPCPLGSTVYIIGTKHRGGRSESWINTGSFRFSDMEKLGVTVFLTRKEAAEALSKTLQSIQEVGL